MHEKIHLNRVRKYRLTLWLKNKKNMQNTHFRAMGKWTSTISDKYYYRAVPVLTRQDAVLSGVWRCLEYFDRILVGIMIEWPSWNPKNRFQSWLQPVKFWTIYKLKCVIPVILSLLAEKEGETTSRRKTIKKKLPTPVVKHNSLLSYLKPNN